MPAIFLAVTFEFAPTAWAQCETGALTAADTAQGDQFGYSAAMCGNVCAIGARLDDTRAINSGSVYVFRYDAMAGAWVQEAKLIASDPGVGDEFGFSVAIQSNATEEIVVVGARHNDDGGTDSGSAYVFRRTSTSPWVEACKLIASDDAAGDRFGYDVGIANDLILVTARDDDTAGANTGSMYAFKREGAIWVQQAKLTAQDAAANDQFGHSLAMCAKSAGGALALVGAWKDDSPLTDAGSAYIFAYDPASSAWSQVAKLIAPDQSTSDEFGFSAAIRESVDGSVALIGARNDDDHGSNAGSAYVFRFKDGLWLLEAKLLPSDGAPGDQFGFRAALSADGHTAAIGAWQHDEGAVDAGTAYLMRHDSEADDWFEIAQFISPAPAASEIFGCAIAMGTDRAVIGAYQNSAAGSESGMAYTYAGVSGADANDNAVPDGCDLAGDLDGNGVVDGSDLPYLLGDWGMCEPPPAQCPADLDGNGVVDINDLLIALANWS